MKNAILKVVVICSIALLLTNCSIQPPTIDPTPTATIEPTAEPTTESASSQPITNQPPKKSLVLYGQEYHTAALESFMHDTEISYVPRQVEGRLTAEEIIPRFLSGDDSFDTYMLVSDADYALSLLSKGFYVDLSTNTEMNKIFPHMFPYVIEASTFNNEIFGMPLGCYSSGLLEYPRYDMEKVGWSLAQLQTMDDLFAFTEDWEASDSKKTALKLYKNMVMDQIIMRYIYNRYDYTTYTLALDQASFEDALQDAKKIYDSDYLIDSFEYSMDTSFVLRSAYVPFSPSGQYAPIPRIKGQDDQHAMLAYWLIINPYSHNQDTVIDLFTTLSEMYKLQQYSPKLYHDPAFYKTCSLDIREIQKKICSYTPEYLDRYDDLFTQHHLFFAIPGETDIQEVIQAYLDGHLEINETVLQVQQILDIIAQEQQVAG